MDVFEALSGTLMTAKKRKVVEYDGELLLQRVHDEVVIKLLLREINDTPLPDHDKVEIFKLTKIMNLKKKNLIINH
jgi:hypothetical protein